MLPDRVSNTGPLTYESGALAIALRSPAQWSGITGTYWGPARCAGKNFGEMSTDDGHKVYFIEK